jgi:hypothetical protein
MQCHSASCYILSITSECSIQHSLLTRCTNLKTMPTSITNVFNARNFDILFTNLYFSALNNLLVTEQKTVPCVKITRYLLKGFNNENYYGKINKILTCS